MSEPRIKNSVFNPEKVNFTESDSKRFCGAEETDTVEPPQQVNSVLSRNVSKNYESQEIYSHEGNRMIALVFNHEIFLNLPMREGTQVDKECLAKCLQKYMFEVEDIPSNMKKKDVFEKLKEVSQRDHTDTVCLLVTVLTHGSGEGKLAAHDDWYKLDDMISCFTSDCCPSLTGKPKLFFIQACRGEKVSVAAQAKTMQTDNINNSSHFSIPEEADILVFYSTYEGRLSYRDTVEGSWFIQELCAELNKNGSTDDLLTMLTRVNRNVADRRVKISGIRERKQMPVIQTCLTKKFYFSGVNREMVSNVERKLKEIQDTLNDLKKLQSTGSKQTKDTAQPQATDRKSVTQADLRNLNSTLAYPQTMLPASYIIYDLGTHLNMFLTYEGKNLTEDAFNTGIIILSYLSNWTKIEEPEKKFLYEQLIYFFVKHAKKWKFFNILKISEAQILAVQKRKRTSSDSLQSNFSNRKQI